MKICVITIFFVVISLTDNYSQQLYGTYRSTRGDEILFYGDSFRIKLFYSTLISFKFGVGDVNLTSKGKYLLDLDSLFKTNKLACKIISQKKSDSTIINVDLFIYSDSLNCPGINWGLRNFDKYLYHSEFESICNISVNISKFENKANMLFISSPDFTDLEINIDKNTITHYKVFLVSDQQEIPAEKMKIRLIKYGSKLILYRSMSISGRKRVIFEKE